MGRPFLKAGLIGAAVLVLLNLIGVVPIAALGCLILPLELIAYVATGALAAYYLPPRRETGSSAGQGALAGLIAGLVTGLMQVILTPLGLTMSGGTAALVTQIPPELLAQLEQANIDPNSLFGAGTFAGIALLCCLPVSLFIGAGLGALGGVIFAAARPD